MTTQQLNPWNWFKDEDGSTEPPAVKALVPLRDEIDRAFAGFMTGKGWPSLAEVRERLSVRPSLDIRETKKGYEIEVEVPGVKKKDVKVTVKGDRLSIRGVTREVSEKNKGNVHTVERRYGSFQRVLALPPDADVAKVKTKVKKGVLTVTFGKRVPKVKKGGKENKVVKAPKKVAAKNVTAKKAATKKVATKKVAPRKVATKKAAAKKVATKKVATKKVAPENEG